MKQFIVALLALTMYTTTHAQGINFEHGTFAEALAKARAETQNGIYGCLYNLVWSV